MGRNIDIARLIEESEEHTNVESLFFADVILCSGEVYDAEITYNTDYDNNGKIGATYFAAIIDQPQGLEKEIEKREIICTSTDSMYNKVKLNSYGRLNGKVCSPHAGLQT